MVLNSTQWSKIKVTTLIAKRNKNKSLHFPQTAQTSPSGFEPGPVIREKRSLQPTMSSWLGVST